MKQWVYLQNEFVDATKAVLPVTDLSINRGYGVFDFIRTQNHQPVFLQDHINRFYASADAMHLIVPEAKEKLIEIINLLCEKNKIPSSGIRITLTGGESADGYSLTNPNLIITQQPLELPPSEKFNAGLKLITHQHQRQLSHVKTIDYLMAIWLQPLLKEKQADDILYHQNGLVTECPRSNFYIINKDDSIVTPSENILHGVTRKNLLKLDNHFKIKEGKITLDDIKNAKSAFISSTSKIVLPVMQVDDVVFKEHEIVKDIKNAFCTSYNLNA
jgi:branched-chain amino acid aminotransferase